MRDPVVDPEGNSYERAAIVAWVTREGTSPITRRPLTVAQLAPNRALKEIIEAGYKRKECPEAAPAPPLVSPVAVTATCPASLATPVAAAPVPLPAPFPGFMSDANGWDQNQYASTIHVLTDDATGDLYAIGRGARELHLATLSVATGAWTLLPSFEYMSDAAGWSNACYYKTIRVVMHDGRLYVLGRGAKALHLAAFDVATATWTALALHPCLTDASGWSDPRYFTTVRVVAAGGRIFVAARGACAVHLCAYSPASATWATLPTLAAFADAEGYGDIHCYSTFDAVAVGASDLAVACRGPLGLRVGVYDAAAGAWALGSLFPLCRDDQGWGKAHYATTIRVAAVDGRVYVCGRGAGSIHLAAYNTATQVCETVWRTCVVPAADLMC